MAAAFDIDPIAAQLARQIEQHAQDAYLLLLQLIAQGVDARQAVAQVLGSFNGQYAGAVAQAFSAALQQAVDAPAVLAMPVAGVALSQHLYAHVQQTQGAVAAIVRQHAQGLHDARALARRLYDGYNRQDGIVRPLEGAARAHLPQALRELTAFPQARQSLAQLLEQMQQQASRLQSPALQASYLQLLDDWAKDKGQQVLQQRLWVAQREKTRYMANRIAQTELARAYSQRVGEQFMQDAAVEVVQVKMNPRHPSGDICDLHASVDLYGLGPGCYPKAKAPLPIFHPHCWCKLISRPDLSAAQAPTAQERPEAVRQYLRGLPPAQAARLLGNRERLTAVLNGADWQQVTQAGVRLEYRLKRLGELGAGPLPAPQPAPQQAIDWAQRQRALGFPTGKGWELQPHEVEFYERFAALGQRAQLIARSDVGQPTNDFLWVDKGLEIEVKKPQKQPSYGTISRQVREAVSKARNHSFIKDRFIIDLGDKTLKEKLRNQLAYYNANNPDNQIRSLWVFSKGELIEIVQLAPQ